MFMVSSLQNRYIDTLIQSKSETFLYLKNGSRLIGTFMDQTEEAVFIRSGITNRIEKKLISTIYQKS